MPPALLMSFGMDTLNDAEDNLVPGLLGTSAGPLEGASSPDRDRKRGSSTVSKGSGGSESKLSFGCPPPALLPTSLGADTFLEDRQPPRQAQSAQNIVSTGDLQGSSSHGLPPTAATLPGILTCMSPMSEGSASHGALGRGRSDSRGAATSSFFAEFSAYLVFHFVHIQACVSGCDRVQCPEALPWHACNS